MTKLKCKNKECNFDERVFHGHEPKEPTKTNRSKDYDCPECGKKMEVVE